MVSIDVWNASVDFPIFDAKTRSLKKAVLGKVGGKIGTDQKAPIIEALHDITLSAARGRPVGLVGHNGAGKSTLLRMLAGIYEPTRGTATSSARSRRCSTWASAWTRRSQENIIIRGLFLGMTRKQMEKPIDEITEFTELGDYIQMPLRRTPPVWRVRLQTLGRVDDVRSDLRRSAADEHHPAGLQPHPHTGGVRTQRHLDVVTQLGNSVISSIRFSICFLVMRETARG